MFQKKIIFSLPINISFSILVSCLSNFFWCSLCNRPLSCLYSKRAKIKLIRHAASWNENHFTFPCFVRAVTFCYLRLFNCMLCVFTVSMHMYSTFQCSEKLFSVAVLVKQWNFSHFVRFRVLYLQHRTVFSWVQKHLQTSPCLENKNVFCYFEQILNTSLIEMTPSLLDILRR